jgi:SAM-dependent methyltransferase
MIEKLPVPTNWLNPTGQFGGARATRYAKVVGMTDPISDSVSINKAYWNDRAPAHTKSRDYGVNRFETDPNFLSDVVRFDQPRLGDLTGLRGVHLQCHIGTDTLSLARLGAQMSGLDFSPVALEAARRLAAATGTDITYREAEVYDAVTAFGGQGFDLVYTGVGALCWLPEIARWARVVADLLVDGGRLFIREGHPMLWSLDENTTPPSVAYSYFEQVEPFAYEESGTYVDTDAIFSHDLSHSWNHGLAEIITALTNEGLSLTQFVEHNSVPWNALPGQMTVDEHGEWRLSDRPDRLAASYTLQAVRRRR